MNFSNGCVGSSGAHEVIYFYFAVLTDAVDAFVCLEVIFGVPRLLNENGSSGSGHEV